MVAQRADELLHRREFAPHGANTEESATGMFQMVTASSAWLQCAWYAGAGGETRLSVGGVCLEAFGSIHELPSRHRCGPLLK